MNPVDMASVGLIALWILLVLCNVERCCPVCGAPLSECKCPSSL